MTPEPFAAAALPLPVSGPSLIIRVVGAPVAQGSMIGYVVKGRVLIVASNKKLLGPWRKAVMEAARSAATAARWVRFDGPLRVDIDYWLPRPAAAKTREWPYKKPDKDKLDRAVFDALTTAAVIVDDSRIVGGASWKRYEGPGRPPGCRIELTNGIEE